MPSHRDAPSPLPRRDIQVLLCSIFHDRAAPSAAAVEALTVTAASLYGWCDPADVDAALAMVGTMGAPAPGRSPALA